MLSPSEAQARAAALVEAATRAGADAADALYVGEASTEVGVRLGELEDVGRSEGEEIGLRLFFGPRVASVSSSDLSADALGALVERAAAMAREASPDQYAGLAPEELLFREALPDLQSDDGGNPAPIALRERALEAEDAARAVAGVTNSEGTSASAGRSVVALATSAGFAGAYSTTGYGLSASVLAGAGGDMQRDYEYSSARHQADLDGAAAVGRIAGERAVRRVGARPVASGPLPIIFDPRVASSMLGHLVGAITGGAVARGTTFLLGKLGEPVFAPGVRVLDDPLRRRGLRSKPFDGEGVATGPRALIDDGRLTTWLLDSASARQLGMMPTGHATRGTSGPPGASATNLWLEVGTATPADLMDVPDGLYVTELIGQGLNPITGDYSRGASGFRVSRGELGAPFQEVTIAGSILDMFAALVPANDLSFRRGVDSPTIRIDGMTAASA